MKFLKIAAVLCGLSATTGFANGPVGGSSSSVGTGLGGNASATVTDGLVALEVTGSAAQTIYDNLDVQVSGPFATGLCLPGRPCDPPTFWGKSGNGVSCSKVTHSVSGKVEFSCRFKIASDGEVTAQ